MEEGMVARALKSSLCRELTGMKSTQQVLYEEFMCLKANNGVPGEEFSVDDLLDFSNGEFHVDNGNDEEKDSSSASFSSQDHMEDDNNSNSSGFSGANDSDSMYATGLAVPTDDIAELEWVSHFVDDSVPELSLLYPKAISGQLKNTASVSFIGKRRPEVPAGRPRLTRGLSFTSPVPVKPRSKRQRPNGSSVWLSGSSGSSSQADISSSPSCSSGIISSTPCLILNRVTEPPVKKQKKTPEGQTRATKTGDVPPFQRRCSHCQVQKTPQWRAGPLGAKTLCNACGVRYKSGRLFPEYRPACSPTFAREIHSNSHRKVLEMRKRKEQGRPEPGLTQTHIQKMVTSC